MVLLPWLAYLRLRHDNYLFHDGLDAVHLGRDHARGQASDFADGGVEVRSAHWPRKPAKLCHSATWTSCSSSWRRASSRS